MEAREEEHLKYKVGPCAWSWEQTRIFVASHSTQPKLGSKSPVPSNSTRFSAATTNRVVNELFCDQGIEYVHRMLAGMKAYEKEGGDTRQLGLGNCRHCSDAHAESMIVDIRRVSEERAYLPK